MTDLVYKISTGELTYNGNHIAHGYSGYGAGKNNPYSVSISDVGPIPIGVWTIGNAHDSTEHGPFVLPLEPAGGTETYGRSGFLIHGDSIPNPGNASRGCIILDHTTREYISQHCKEISVIP